MSRIVLSTSGSYGDIHPYIAVAIGLKSRGHDVVVATSEYYRDKILGEGLQFHPVRPDFVPMEAEPEIVRRSFDPLRGANYVLKELVLPHVANTYSDLLSACEGADLFIIHPTLFPAPLVAEKLRLKWLSVVLSPAVFVSAFDPPIFPPIPWFNHLRRLGPGPHRLVVKAMKRLTYRWMDSIRELRRKEGLSESRGCPMHDEMFSPYGTMAWFSSLLASAQPDWPVSTTITGFPVYDKNLPREGLDPVLKNFLKLGEPPVVFTLGSSAVVDPGSFFQQSLMAIQKIGQRAVFLVGKRNQEAFKQFNSSTTLVAGYAPYSQLFPKASVVVHQGGIGTVAQTLQAGVPALVVPLGLDQPDNAARVARLGVGRVISRRQYTAERCALHLHSLLSEPKYKLAAKLVADRLLAEDGISGACDTIEAVCGVAHRQPAFT